MFWNKSPNKEEVKTEPSEKLNYTVLKNGDIQITCKNYDNDSLRGYHLSCINIKKEDILELNNNMIKCIMYEDKCNEHTRAYWNGETPIVTYSLIEDKVDHIEWKQKSINTYSHLNDYWYLRSSKLVEKFDQQTTPIQELFAKKWHSKYKLIESEEELNNYLQSKLSCDDWCRLKLVTKMKELNLGMGFITAFADLIGNDLDKYHTMIDLASEVKDKDILMYLFVYKFGKKEDESCNNLTHI